MLLVFLVQFAEAGRVRLIFEQFLSFGQIQKGFIEVSASAMRLGSTHRGFVAKVRLLVVAVIEDLAILKHTRAVINSILPHLEL